MISDGHIHDTIRPVGSDEVRPIRALAPAANSPHDAAEEGIRRGRDVLKDGGQRPA
jgi:hypothetical protein